MKQSILHDVVASSTNLATNTKAKYLRDLNQWIAYAGDNPANWTRRRAQNFYQQLLTKMRPQSANRLMASVQYAAKWWSIQEDNPALNFAIVQRHGGGETINKQALTAEQARALLTTCRYQTDPLDVRDFAMMVIGLETGMRRMSLRSMLFEQCFLAGDAKTGFPSVRVIMKGRDLERVPVPISDAAIVALTPWMGWLRQHGINQGPIFRGVLKRIGPDGRIVYRPKTTALSESAIHTIIRSRGETSGIELSPHVFRHTFVTWRMQAGYKPHEVSAVTGHKLRELGALGEYLDPVAVGHKMRESTPQWLTDFIASKGHRVATP